MNNLYTDFAQKILNLPLWVKEIVYFMLKKNLQETLPCSNIDTREEDLYQYLCPEITYAGKKQYEKLQANSPNSDDAKFLQALLQNLSIIEITLNNAWTLEETSQIYYSCIENQFVAVPENPVILAKAAYFANKIRIGEYLKRVGVINVDQLEQAMRIQRDSELANEKRGFASILVDMGFVTRNDTDNILLIKQESKKRFILNFNTSESSTETTNLALEESEKQIEKLSYENRLLKAKLREMLNLGNKQ